MDMPRLSGYPIDHATVRRSELERRARRARKRGTRPPRRWLGWLAG